MENTAGIALLIRTLLALGCVCGLAYLSVRFVLPALQAKTTKRNLIRIVEKIQVGSTLDLLLVEVCGKYYLIGGSTHSANLIAEIEPQLVDLKRDENLIPIQKDLWQKQINKFRGVLNRKT